MELLTADDVLNKTFSTTKFREGYDVEEVDDFLDLVLGTLRSIYAENEDLKGQLAASQERVAELARNEGSSAVAAAPVEVPAPVEAVVAEPEPVVAAPAVPAAEPEAATGIIQLAQKLHDDHVRAGQEEGDRLISEARSESARIVREAEETSARTLSKLEQDRGVLERKIDELRTFERDYRSRLKGYLENLLGDLGSAEGPSASSSVSL